MRRHARTPGGIILALAVAACAWMIYAEATQASARRAAATQGDAGTLQKLEIAIAEGRADAEVWQAYGDALADARRFAHAADAYKRALEMEPDRREARVARLLTLAQGPDPDAFFTYATQMTNTDAKLTFDLLDRREITPMKTDPRWDALYRTARAQAVD